MDARPKVVCTALLLSSSSASSQPSGSQSNTKDQNSDIVRSGTGLTEKKYPAVGASVIEASSGFVIYVYTGDITKSETAAITTGEGFSILGISQVSNALSKLSPYFCEEREKLFKYGATTLSAGHVYSTYMKIHGLLKCILHAVVPYHDREMHDVTWEEMMADLYKKVCQTADAKCCVSVAIPLLGTGQGKGSTDSSVQAVAAGLKQYADARLMDTSKHKHMLNEVHIVVFNDSLKTVVVQEIQRAICSLKDSTTFKSIEMKQSQASSEMRNPHNLTKLNYDRDIQEGVGHLSLGSQDQVTWGSSGTGPRLRNRPYKQQGDRFVSSENLQYVTKIAVGLPDSTKRQGSKKNINSYEPKPDYPGHSIEEGYNKIGVSGLSVRKKSDSALSEESDTEAASKISEASKDKVEDVCPICMDKMTNPKVLDKCKHVFCHHCIDTSFKMYKPICPSCQTAYGEIIGNMPKNGIMKKQTITHRLPGHESYGTIIINYHFPDGIQSEEHPNPRVPYRGTSRTAYLPDSPEGRKVLKLLEVAWERRLTFTVGKSTTTGRDNVVTWNDIHHKTNTTGGESHFGYPDNTYLTRVTEELASKGVTEADLDYFQ